MAGRSPLSIDQRFCLPRMAATPFELHHPGKPKCNAPRSRKFLEREAPRFHPPSPAISGRTHQHTNRIPCTAREARWASIYRPCGASPIATKLIFLRAVEARPIAPASCAVIRIRGTNFRSAAWTRKANAAIAPTASRSGFCDLPSSKARQAAATTARLIAAMSAVHHSCLVLTRTGVVPRRLSMGVLSQKRDRAATTKISTGQSRLAEKAPAATPANSGTKSRPHAPCSRGTIRERVRSRRTAATLLST